MIGLWVALLLGGALLIYVGALVLAAFLIDTSWVQRIFKIHRPADHAVGSCWCQRS